MDFQLPDDLFLTSLSPTDSATPIRLEQRIVEAFGSRAFVACSSLDVDEYERLGHCEQYLLDSPHPIAVVHWGGEDNDRLFSSYEQALWRIRWRGAVLHVVKATWQTSCGGETRHWVVADDRETAESFVLDLQRTTNDPGESILVFHGGYWQRSRELYRSTQQASFDELVLSGSLKDVIRADFHQFLGAQ